MEEAAAKTLGGLDQPLQYIIAQLSSVELNKEFDGRKDTKKDLKSRKDNRKSRSKQPVPVHSYPI
jgi:hypothetical protein